MNIANFNGLAPFLMNEAGGDMGGGGGSVDTGSTALAISTGTDVTTTGDTGGGDGTGGDTSVTTTGGNEPVFDNSGRLTQGTSKVFRELETANPNARNILGRAQRALGTMGKLTSMLGPKPFDRINELRKFEKEVGGLEGLRALRESVADIELTDSLYERADPMLLNQMTETPAAKQAFVKLWPHAVNKMRELSPQAYTRWLGVQVMNALQKLDMEVGKDRENNPIMEPIDMPFRLRRVYGLLPPLNAEGKIAGGTMTPEQQYQIQVDLGMIYAWVERMRSWSNATPEDLTPPKEDTAAAELTQAKTAAEAALQDAWKIQRDAAANEMIGEEVRKQTKGMDLSSTIIADISARVRKAINDARKARPDNSAKIGGFFQAKNLQGYLAYNKSVVQDVVQTATEKAVALYGRKSTRRGPQSGADTTQKTATTQTTATAQQSQQQASGNVVVLNPKQVEALGGRSNTRWTKMPIGGAKGTTTAMLMKGQKMLKGGNPAGLPDGTIVQFP